MKYLLDSVQMKAADRYTIEVKKIPSISLMERAARAAAEEISKLYQGHGEILVVCGSGNNGGDGFAAARFLKERGYRVRVVFVGKKEKRTIETSAQWDLCEKAKIKIQTEIGDAIFAVVADAVFGIGLSREVTGEYAEVIKRMNALGGIHVAIDIASGISADTGAKLGTAFRADYTITFAYGKLGQFLYPGADYSGKVIVRDIGIKGPKEARREYVRTYGKNAIRKHLPARAKHSNKGTYGKALIVAGSPGMAGAAYLAGLAAYRSGAGLVRIYTAAANRVVLQELLPEAILTTYEDGSFDGAALSECIKWADYIAAGCGLGTGVTSAEMIRRLLQEATCPMILDADGLNILSQHKDWIYGYRGSGLILTPHLKEMSRLTGQEVGAIASNLIKTAADFSKTYGVICVLKDSHTVVTAKEGPAYLNLSGTPAMAKAGAGDVLTGILLGLCCNHLEIQEAARLGVYLHGKSGELAAKRTGEYGILAREIADAAPIVIQKNSSVGEKKHGSNE